MYDHDFFSWGFGMPATRGTPLLRMHHLPQAWQTPSAPAAQPPLQQLRNLHQAV
jgi:hypothetical protein